MTERVPRGQTVIRRYYLRVLTTLGERVRRKQRPESWENDCWILTIETMRRFIMPYLLSGFWPKIQRQRYNTSPLFAPDLAPCDFWILPKLKCAFRGNTFLVGRSCMNKILV